MDFPSIKSFVGFLAFVEAKSHEHHAALEKAAKLIEDEAKDSLGHYQGGWPRLAESTIRKKGGRDEPLLDTGELRDSITHEVRGNEARIGSDLDKAAYAEFGTSYEPPRSWLLSATLRKEPEVVKILGEHGRRLISGS
jgi:HK97 gp10 family phage protein